MIFRLSAFVLTLLTVPAAFAQEPSDPFQQLDSDGLLPTPTEVRTASGAPGPSYWQQQVDYDIDVTLHESQRSLSGRETITYQNNSPHTLNYLWLQLDPNRFTPHSDAALGETRGSMADMSFDDFKQVLARYNFDGGMKIRSVTDARLQPLNYRIVRQMMRVDLAEPLGPGQIVRFSVSWTYKINNSEEWSGRTGYEVFDDGNAVFCIAQWFPRLCSYTDYGGWRHQQFLGYGEFTLEFGTYDVRITVPADHVVSATGELQNRKELLTKDQWVRFLQAQEADEPVFIVTPNEAEENEKARALGTKVWTFHAENVRDFAFATSRKFIWDAMRVRVGDRDVLCQSLYTKEGQPLWNQYATHAVAHAVEVYSRLVFDYPYSHATAVMGVVGGGMEYPMICFNGPRPEKDGTYSKEMKYRLIKVIIHEVGHNWFPMIVNSDERQWMWLDEGLNSFVEYLAAREWEQEFESNGAEPDGVIWYLTSKNKMPVMTRADSVKQRGGNAYRKPAAALNILRETILGRELFDSAFQEYALRWRFKRPTPADFFRTLEDASGTDLDWFFRGWFFSTEHVDLSLDNLRLFKINDGDPADAKQREAEKKKNDPTPITRKRSEEIEKRIDRFPGLSDFYNDYDPHEVTEEKLKTYREFLEKLTPEEHQLLKRTDYFYIVDIKNIGGLVMPILLHVTYVDGSTEDIQLPAAIWRQNDKKVSKLILARKQISAIELDPHNETFDSDRSNNRIPRKIPEEFFKLTKPEEKIDNPLKKSLDKEKEAEPKDESETAEDSE
ncbi:M1 family metallopeptidase [Calycomorphotria hydatis]|nr:M1 family metallopeptidase [Calycomorphotria hydatis]